MPKNKNQNQGSSNQANPNQDTGIDNDSANTSKEDKPVEANPDNV